MKTQEKLNKAFLYFKESYDYKMGGTQTVMLPNGHSKEFDDREYYSGRGAKYNNTIRHDDRGEVKVTRREYSAFLQILREAASRRQEREQQQKAMELRINEAKEEGIYSIDDEGYVELSEGERHGRTFDEERLAATLKISVSDAQLLNSEGKTYVFAQSEDGKIYQLYHPSLDCNDLYIHVSVPTPEKIAKFNHDEWASAPYAALVGQTANKNHFVC